MEPEEYTPYEEQLADRIRQAGQRSTSLGEVALGIGAAFLLYRAYTRRRFKEEAAAGRLATPESVQELATRILSLYIPRWAATAGPALATGYYLGLRDAGEVTPSDMWVVDSANNYARTLGTHLHEVSTQALVEGIHRQINARVATRVAIDRTIDAFGVAPRTMKSIVNLYLAPAPQKVASSRQQPRGLKDRIDAMVARSIQERAQTIGDTEAHLASRTAKSLYWSYKLDRGDISPLAQKEWVTARDERTCQVCAPMHRKRVGLNELFELPTGEKVIAPAVHPRCRCDIVLYETTQAKLDAYNHRGRYALAKADTTSAFGVVHKAVGGDPYDRDSNGRFAERETRRVRPAQPKLRRLEYAEPEVDFTDPRVADILSQASSMMKSPPKASGTPKATGSARASSTPKATSTPKASANVQATSTPMASAQVASGKVDSAKATSPLATAARVHNQAVKARMDSKKASFIAPDKPMSPTASANDVWVNTPNNRPIFVIMDEDQWGYDGETVLTDEYMTFFTGGDKGYGIHTLEQAVSEYWDYQVEMHVESEWDALATHHPDLGENFITYGHGNMVIHVPYEAFEIAFWEAVYGLTPRESEQVEVLAEDSKHNTQPMFINATEVGEALGLDSWVEALTPYVGRTTKINADTFDEDQWGNLITNPGKWRIVSSDLGSTTQYMGRSIPLPYHMYDIDPEDLYGED